MTDKVLVGEMSSDKDSEHQRLKRKEAKRLAKLLKFENKKNNPVFNKASKKPVENKAILLGITSQVCVKDVDLGKKKDITDDFPAKYDSLSVESTWYDWWLKSGLFKPEFQSDDNKDRGVFSIVIPPPNVTGSLHIGHALTCSIEDSLVRWHRMQGKRVLFLPGIDHAGIATQSVVEKSLMKLEGKTRHHYGREEFIKKVFEWKEKHGSHISKQLARMGVSVDWSRERFTMDKTSAYAVAKAFLDLYDNGYIYRSNKLVNWCPILKTALSNLEVENKEIKEGTTLIIPVGGENKKYKFGYLYTFSYKIKGSDDLISVSTTRLETMLGDVAVAVNPNDNRYSKYVGKTAVHPFINREILIISDDSVDIEFGTGAVKITPAHDHNDFEIAQRHNLPFINIFDDSGYLNENTCEPFIGMYRFDVREELIKRLTELKLYVKTEGYTINLPICSRSNDIIEPLIKDQWWMRCSDLGKRLIDLENSKKLIIRPKYAATDWHKWLENVQDWCISRQIWWGHRIPAYLIKLENQKVSDNIDKNKYWVAALNYEDAMKKAEAKFPNEKFVLEQDNDVLDTWFSSALWPFSTMGWPNDTNDMNNFYPNNLLETGWDILFFWVARMCMMGLALTDKAPFNEVYCHAIVRDANNRKMSKSLGNVIDPLDVINGITLKDLNDKLHLGNLPEHELKKAIELQKHDFPNGIPTCGADALRFTLLSYVTQSRSINLDVLRIEGYRKWCNKIWNASKFVHCHVSQCEDLLTINEIDIEDLSLLNKWILQKLQICIDEVNSNFATYNFMSVTSSIHRFFTGIFCDFYLEMVKPLLYEKPQNEEVKKSKAATKTTMLYVLNRTLKLLHPIMPFITEELYQRVNKIVGDDPMLSIMVQKFPEENVKLKNLNVTQFDDLVNAIQSIRSTLKSSVYKEIKVLLVTDNEKQTEFFEEHIMQIKSVIKAAQKLSISTIKPEHEEKYTNYSKVDISQDLHALVLCLE